MRARSPKHRRRARGRRPDSRGVHTGELVDATIERLAARGYDEVVEITVAAKTCTSVCPARSHPHDVRRDSRLDRRGAAEPDRARHHERRAPRGRLPREAAGSRSCHRTATVSLIRVQERETGFFSDLEGLLERLVPLDGRRADAARLDAARPSHRADSLQRGGALPRPLSADLPRGLRGSLQQRVDVDRRRVTRAVLTDQGFAQRAPIGAHYMADGTSAASSTRSSAARARPACARRRALGRSLAHRLDFGRHVAAPYAGADYYPILLAVVKVAVALMLARVAWRFVKARTVACAARRRLLRTRKSCARSAPRVRIELSPRLWLGSFLVTSADLPRCRSTPRASQPAAGRSCSPWLHTAALPGLRGARRRRRAHLPRGRELALRLRELRRETPPRARHVCSRGLPVPRPASASSSPRAASSGSRSKSRPPPAPA